MEIFQGSLIFFSKWELFHGKKFLVVKKLMKQEVGQKGLSKNYHLSKFLSHSVRASFIVCNRSENTAGKFTTFDLWTRHEFSPGISLNFTCSLNFCFVFVLFASKLNINSSLFYMLTVPCIWGGIFYRNHVIWARWIIIPWQEVWFALRIKHLIT